MRGLGGCTYVRLFPRASEASMSFRKYRNWPFLTAFLKPGIWNDRLSSIKPASLHKNPPPPSFLRKKQTNKQTINQSSKPLAQSNKTMEFKKVIHRNGKKLFTRKLSIHVVSPETLATSSPRSIETFCQLIHSINHVTKRPNLSFDKDSAMESRACV